MHNEELVRKMNARLASRQRSFKWFVERYLPGIPYGTLGAQRGGFAPVSERFADAIKRFLADVEERDGKD